MNHSTPGLPVHHRLPEFAQTHAHRVMPFSHLILCGPLLLLPPIPPSIRVFSNESTLHMRWPKYWSFSFSISPSNEHPGLISFRMNWLDLLAVQGTLKSLLQQHRRCCYQGLIQTRGERASMHNLRDIQNFSSQRKSITNTSFLCINQLLF